MARRHRVLVACKSCSSQWMKRADSVATWGGQCRSCAMREMCARPEILALKREVGKRVMAAVGKLPHYPHNYRSGPASNKWKGGVTPQNSKIRHSPEMKSWRAAVFERDNYTCVCCGKRGGDLEADHIKPFSLFPDLRTDVNNGRTVCKPCHRLYGAKVCDGKLIRPAQAADGTNWLIG